MSGADRQTDSQKWDARHRGSLGRDLPEVSPWLSRFEDLWRRHGAASPSPRALDVACGRGRHAVYLASLGFTADAVDVSSVAIDDLQRRAGDLKLPVSPRVVDLSRVDGLDEILTASYDVILVFRYLDRDLAPHLERALRPGGYLLFETFVASADGRTDFNPAYLLAPGELSGLFPSLRVEHIEDGLDDGRAVSRLLARRT